MPEWFSHLNTAVRRLAHSVPLVVVLPLLLVLAGCGILPGSGNSTVKSQSTATSAIATPTAVPMLKIVTPTPGTPIPIATTAQGSPASGASGETVSYVVKPGDTLDAIAAEHNISVKTLEEMNGITNPTDLQAGQVIKIPRTP